MCDPWTIFTTLVVGALIGFFITAGGLALMIRSESKERRRQRAEVTAEIQPPGLVDHTQNHA